MEAEIARLKERNAAIQIEIRQMRGQGLDDLSFQELCELTERIEEARNSISKMKYQFLDKEIQMAKRKIRKAEQSFLGYNATSSSISTNKTGSYISGNPHVLQTLARRQPIGHMEDID